MKKFLALLIFITVLALGVLTGCGDTPGSEHNYVPTVIEPTCEGVGYTEFTCTHCGDCYVSLLVPATGHSEQPIADVLPTCTTDGHTGGVECATCKTVLTQPTKVNKTGHSYQTTVVDPTCEARGYTVYICTDCQDAYNDDYVPATGHTWSAANEEGIKTCTACQAEVKEAAPTLIVTYVDVGQGDCILIKLGDCDILIDAGKPEYGTTVSKYLKDAGVDDIELMINTHLDNDHYGGLPQVFKDFDVEAFWGTGYNKSGSGIDSLKKDIKNEGLEYVTPAVGTVFTHQKLTLTVIYNGEGASSSNDSSIVVMLEYGEFKFLFTGDIGQKAEGKLVSEGADLACDVLKVGHHGSKTSSTAAFLAATGAKYAVICVGAGNSYGHPTSAALNNLAAAGIAVARTDLNGHVIFTTDGTELMLPEVFQTDAATATVTEVVLIPDMNQLSELLKRRYLVGAAA